MSDLISRSDVMKLLTNLQLEFKDLHDAKRFVAVLPTAYDVNKVIEEIEEEYEYCDNHTCKHCKFHKVGKGCLEVEILPENVKEIVKAGGVHE